MNIVLLALGIILAAVGFGIQHGDIPPKAPPQAAFALAGLILLIWFYRILPRGGRRAVTFTLTAVVLVGLVGGIYYFQFIFKPVMLKDIISVAMAPKPSTVSAETPKLDAWTPKLTAIGTIHAFQGIDAAPQVGGIIRAIHFQSSEDVAAGALLAEIDDSTDQADLKSAVATLKNADVALDRQQTLVTGGNTAKAQVDQALAARDTAAAAVERVRAVIAQKQIVAPFAGRLGIRKVDVGQYVSPGMSLVTLQQLDPIYVDFQTPEQQMSTLGVGEDVNVMVDAYPGKVFAGKVSSIDARVSSDTRNVLVRAQLPNPDHILLPGMFANVEVTVGKPADVLTLPRTAISFSLYGDNIFVVKPAPPKEGEAQAAPAEGGPKVVERRFVRVGEARGERVSLLEGVAPGETVVTSGQVKLQPGFPVIVDNSAALAPRAQVPKP
jgi:RND family efflux transporter MFP subunit